MTFLPCPLPNAQCQSLGFLIIDALDRILERRDERLRVSQVAFSQLKFRDHHTVFVHNDQPIAIFHNDTSATCHTSLFLTPPCFPPL